MDGWAVRGAGPWRAAISTTAVVELGDGEYTSIVTGGLIPAGTTAVVRSEIGAVEGGRLHLTSGAKPDEPGVGQHIRAAGEEVTAGETVIEAGTRLNPAHVAVAAGCGRDELDVVPLPRIALVLTGDEVVEAGIPAPGQVRDSFGPMLPALIERLHGEVTTVTRLHDDLDALIAALAAEPRDDASSRRGTASPDDPQLIITTGGTGHSSADHLRTALHALGATILVEGVLMRPGAPSLLARLPDGRYLVGLPGNPLAAIMGLLTLGRPLIAALSGSRPPELDSVTLGCDIAPGKGSAILAPYHLVDGDAVVTGWRGSGMLRGLSEAHGILVCPPEGGTRGLTVTAIPLPW